MKGKRFWFWYKGVRESSPMEQYKQPAPAQAAPVAAPAQAPVAGNSKLPNVFIKSPTWVTALRIVQVVASLVVLGCCGWLIHGAYSDPHGFAIACVSPSPVLTLLLLLLFFFLQK